ncbi:hypothetical protein ABVF54_14965 [Enterococcus mundtii]|uniref:Uncharacterized protein n=1 Tax=Enterococcus mundtii TaxID=53346 RepID=A0AAI8WDY3_ENTMU|nr:hypothetical protein [Enterococcus mundtii]BBM14977.1 uncharacterized protein EM151A_1785 [Enterococcus mundtii]
MSKLKVEDNVFYKGDEGIIREVMIDGKEDFYRVDVSKKSIHYLYEDELDLVTQKLNDNQKVVLEWLKEKYTYTDIGAIELFWRLKVNSTKEKYRYRDVYMSYKNMTNSEQLQILAAFAQWALEQEAVNEK